MSEPTVTQPRAGEETADVAILGGGPAGLATAWALARAGRRALLLEAAPVPGGCARTVQLGDFRVDTGPHRFHDRDAAATALARELCGDDLLEVEAPSRIYWRGRFVDFPLRPGQLLGGGAGLGLAVRAGAGFLAARLRNRTPGADFGSFAVAAFGRPIAEAFLLPFSEKLWGLPAGQLSPEIAGRRLPGFRIGALLRELVARGPSRHLEGRFLYPRRGYGQIVDAMAAKLPAGDLRCGWRVRRLEARAQGGFSVECEVGGEARTIAAARVVNTLPITLLCDMLAPAPPAAVREAAARLRFRDLVLVVLLLDQPSVSDAACTYFPSREMDITRIHEPRNRSAAMSPPGKTSLVAEIPCFAGDAVWSRSNDQLVAGATRELAAVGLVRPDRVLRGEVLRLRQAYPVLSADHHTHAAVVADHLRSLPGLLTLGRGGSFFYGHVHDFLAAGRDAAASLMAAPPAANTSP